MENYLESEMEMYNCLSKHAAIIKEKYKDLLTNIDFDNFTNQGKTEGEYGFTCKLGYDKSSLPSEVSDALEEVVKECARIHSDKN